MRPATFFTPLLCVSLLCAACAPLNANRMKDECREAYNACLNDCAGNDSNHPWVEKKFDIRGVQGCTSDCNDRATECERPK